MEYLITLFIVYGFFSIIIFNFAGASRERRMVGGNLAEHNKFPYLVGVLNKLNSTQLICSGSILDDFHVISAAHCFINSTDPNIWMNGSYFVVAGATDFMNGDQTNWVIARVQKTYVPKMYTDSHKLDSVKLIGDIAVLKLETSLNLEKNSHLRAVQLPTNRNLTFVNETAVVSGYGANKSEYSTQNKKWKYTYPNNLRFANVSVLSNSECQSKYDVISKRRRVTHRITEKHICAQVHQRNVSSPEGVCKVDSGGPLVYSRNTLIGVLNTMGDRDCTEKEIPGTYARVTAYMDFIEEARNDKEGYNHDPDTLTYNYI